MFDDLVFSVMTHPRAGIQERVQAAAAAGYAGIGLRPGDLRRARDAGHADADLRRLLERHALVVVEIDAIMGWGGDDDQVRSARAHESRVFELADALGARHVTVIGDVAGPRDRTIELLADLVDRAGEHGLAVGLEYLPWTNVSSLTTALDLVTATGRSNARVVIDAWHHFRGGCDWAALEAIPGDRIAAVQFDDGGPSDGRSLEEQTFDRRLPGEGEFDLVRFLRTVASTGTSAPLCVEVISPRLGHLPVAEVAEQSMTATQEMLRRAGLRS